MSWAPPKTSSQNGFDLIQLFRSGGSDEAVRFVWVIGKRGAEASLHDGFGSG